MPFRHLQSAGQLLNASGGVHMLSPHTRQSAPQVARFSPIPASHTPFPHLQSRAQLENVSPELHTPFPHRQSNGQLPGFSDPEHDPSGHVGGNA